jgi:hypothetical protein
MSVVKLYGGSRQAGAVGGEAYDGEEGARVTAAELVRLGMDPMKGSGLVVTNIIGQLLDQQVGTFRDDNGVQYMKLGFRGSDTLLPLYMKMSTASNYWKSREEEGTSFPFRDSEGAKTAAGLIASTEWKPFALGQEKQPYMILVIPKGLGTPGRPNTGNLFAIIRSRQQFLALCSAFPAPDRFFQEVLCPFTPHKCVMDVERDLRAGSDPAQLASFRPISW